MAKLPTPEDVMIDRLERWKRDLVAIANEMDVVSDMQQKPDLQVLAGHIDSIVDDIEFQQAEVLDTGPIVTFRNGSCSVRSADGE